VGLFPQHYFHGETNRARFCNVSPIVFVCLSLNQFVITSFTEAEAAATSVERMMALAVDTPQEPPHTLQDEERFNLTLPASIAATGPTHLPHAAVEARALGPLARPVAAPAGWPWKGEICFDRVHLRYRDGLECALRGLSFTVPAGTRCGVVGRTGAGAISSIETCLYFFLFA
jgi:ABC-type multidrug transport system fused ATPase/permease subunit